MKISALVQDKIEGKWVTTYTVTDAALVYEDLAHALIAKKLEHCGYIKSITEQQNYNGTVTITVTYRGHVAQTPTRTVYTVKSH